MRDTDMRMAKYSRRGVVVNLLAYLLCLWLGYLKVISPTTAVVLTAGLIITTIIRAFVLVRFEAIYSRGPARWRTLFFIATLIGAAWWSVILTTLTIRVGMVGETPILWLYTIIFFSATLQATTPFHWFSRVYLAVTLTLPTLAAIYLGGFDGYMYGLMMMVFLMMVLHQIEVQSSTHWNRLEANYELKLKARALEMEKRSAQASVELNSRFLESLYEELNQSLDAMVEIGRHALDRENDNDQKLLQQQAENGVRNHRSLLNNIDDFTKINRRELEVNQAPFYLRSEIEDWIISLSDDAHQQNVELDYHIHQECPWRAVGDANRTGQVFTQLLSNAIEFSEKGLIFIDVEFRHTQEGEGQLEIIMLDRSEDDSQLSSAASINARHEERTSGLWFAICNGLAECMGGAIEMDYAAGLTQYKLRLPLQTMADQCSDILMHPGLEGKRVLIVDHEHSVTTQHIDELENWKVQIFQVDSCAEAMARLEKQQQKHQPIDLIVINMHEEKEIAVKFSRKILEATEFGSVPQLYLMSYRDVGKVDVDGLCSEYSHVLSQCRPVSRRRLHTLVTRALGLQETQSAA